MKVTLKNVTKKYGQTIAVNNFSGILPDGQLICLLGPSGCGKSTILNMLCGIVDVTEGQIFFDDEDVTKLPPDIRGIGMVFQNYALYPHLTVLDNICFPLEVQKVPKNERKEKALEIAKLVHVENLITRYPGELSGGQQQRVAIARALIKKPKLLLMDEPLSNLDARLRLEMREEIRRIQQETGVTTIFVTHDQDEAMSISDNIILMKNGELIQEGKCQDLYNSPNCQFVADFLGNPPINKITLSIEELKQLKIQNETFDITNLNTSSTNKVVLAIRPESFIYAGKENTNSKKELLAKVKNVSEMGKEQIITLDFMNSEIRAILHTDEELHPNETICVNLKNKGVFVFDAENGDRLI